MNTKFQQLARIFQKLPGVGPRQAARFVISLLNQPEESLKELGESINNLKRDVGFCGICFNISGPEVEISDAYGNNKSKSPQHQSKARNTAQHYRAGNSHCHICHNTKRDTSKIMVVEKVTDLESIEKTGLYKGLYHVLGGAINPLEKVVPANLKIKDLEKRIDNMLALRQDQGDNLELIVATNPNTPGETTALYIKDLFENKNGITITRLGRGLSSGSHLEYADETTLKHALEYRK